MKTTPVRLRTRAGLALSEHIPKRNGIMNDERRRFSEKTLKYEDTEIQEDNGRVALHKALKARPCAARDILAVNIELPITATALQRTIRQASHGPAHAAKIQNQLQGTTEPNLRHLPILPVSTRLDRTLQDFTQPSWIDL